MTHDMQNNNFYYSGGLAEFVSNPTPLTYSFFSYWFMGSTSLGKAMEILGLPYEKVSLPILELHHGEAVMNIINEEKTLYAKTIFSYAPQKNIQQSPSLQINYTKLCNPFYLFTTAKLAKKQSEWIAFPDRSVTFIQSLLTSNRLPPADSIPALDKQLTNDIWPKILVIGMLCEFYSQLLEKKYKKHPEWVVIQKYIDATVAKNDWFFNSYLHQQKVKEGSLSFDSYIQEYGTRADKDYELTSPRWSEIQDEIKKRIQQEDIRTTISQTTLPKNVDNTLIHAYISLLISRSNAKKLALHYIAVLRSHILSSAKTQDITHLNRATIISGDFSSVYTHPSQKPLKETTQSKKEGIGQGISSGHAKGTTVFIHDTTTSIPQKSVCIFPNASPEFSLLYPKCEGMIFLKGGQTSHGAIVAREFGIPALVDQEAIHIPDNTVCTINGSTGLWSLE